MTVKPCNTCKWCEGELPGDGKCKAIKDPITGTPLMAVFARKDTWEGYALPCGFDGKLWAEKTE